MKLEIAEPFLPLFDPQDPNYHKPYLCWHGGRGSGKTVTVCKGLLVRGFRRKERILCARQFQVSLADSVLKTLEDEIYELGLQDFYEVQNSAIYGANGTEFMFKGLHNNVQSIKSTAGVTLTFLEEAQTISEKSYEILVPTVFRTPQSQIIAIFNPDQETDPTYKRFITKPPPPEDCYICKVDFDSNPWFPPELRREMEYLRRVDPDAFNHVWRGECRVSSDAQVLHGKWCIDRFDTPTEGTELHGLDFGFSQDPLVHLRMWIVGAGQHTLGKLYIEHEIYKVGLEISDTTTAIKSIPGAATHLIRADNARPEMISHLRKEGLNVVAADKWAGSIEDGISVLRSFEQIIIHERCRNTINEARLYSYKQDRLTGDILPDIIDKHNNSWDAARYGLGPVIKRSGPNAGFFQFLSEQDQ